MDDVCAGRCPLRLQPGDVGFQLPRAIGMPFARCTEVKRARVVSHTEPVPVTIYVRTPGGSPAKKVRKLEVETASLCRLIHVIKIADDTTVLPTPTGVATLPTPATPVFEDYFAVGPPVAGAEFNDEGLTAAKVFVAAVTARLKERS